MHHVPGFWLCNSWRQQSSLKYTIGYNDQCRGTGNPSRDLTDVSLPGIHFGTIIIKNINEKNMRLIYWVNLKLIISAIS